MTALSQDLNWLKLIGIFAVLAMIRLLGWYGDTLIQEPQSNAKYATQRLCQEQISNYEQTGQLVEDVERRGWLINAYPEFYVNSTRRSGNKVFHYATSKSPHLKSYVGLVVGLPGTQQRTAIAILCETEKPGLTPASDPIFDNSTLTCGSKTRQVNIPLEF